MGKRKKQRPAKRAGSRVQRVRHRTRARAELLYDPATDPLVAAEILHELSGGDPVDPEVAATIGSRGGMDRLRAVAEAALARGQDPASLSLAADAALMDDRAGDAERYAVRALELADDPDLHVRRALALGRLGRVEEAVDVLGAQLSADPGLEALQLLRRNLLERAEPHVVDRVLGRAPFEELRAAIEEHVDEAIDGEQDWIEAGALTGDELAEWAERAADPRSPEARRVRLMREWAWVMPGPDGERTPLEVLAGDEGAPAELRRRAEDWLTWALWGLWEVGGPDSGPGTVLTDLVTGVRVHAEVPRELLDGLPRWSVLLGYLVPVDGVWHAGSALERATPVEARLLVQELLDELTDSAAELGREGRPMVAWARRVHDAVGPLWLSDAAELPSPEAMIGLQLLFRAVAPHLAAGLREMQGTSPVAQSSGQFEVDVDDPDAAWQALAARADFDLDDEEGLAWLTDDDGEARGYLFRTPDGPIEVTAGRERVDALLDVLRGLGHPATAREVPDTLEPPVALPDLRAAELAAWLCAWPDEPFDLFDGITPRDAVRHHEAGGQVEMLVRYLEHDADRLGVEVGTAALRTELGLENQ